MSNDSITPKPVPTAGADPTKPASEAIDFPARVPIQDFPQQPSGNYPKPPKTLPNIAYMLEANEVSVRYNVIAKRIHIERRGQVLTEADLVSLAYFNGLHCDWFQEFVSDVAHRNPVNPVAEWIDSKPWDGTDRLPDIYATVKVDDELPLTLRDILLRRWLLSAVAAVKVPDFRTRGVLTFQGEQGLGKTRWIKQLLPPDLAQKWIKLDHHLDAGNKDSILGAVSHWIVEIGELESSFRRDIARLKGYLTSPIDKIRLPYGKRPIVMERRTVHAATVNDPNFLTDDTGNSRWWTIPVVGLDYEHNIDMQQLFAQLAVELAEGEQWWLTKPEEDLLEDLNKRHRTMSAIAERLRDRLLEDASEGRYMTATEVLKEVGVNSPSNVQCKEAGTTLRALYGPPKRVQGRDRWRAAFRSEGEYWKTDKTVIDDDEEY